MFDARTYGAVIFQNGQAAGEQLDTCHWVSSTRPEKVLDIGHLRSLRLWLAAHFDGCNEMFGRSFSGGSPKGLLPCGSGQWFAGVHV